MLRRVLRRIGCAPGSALLADAPQEEHSRERSLKHDSSEHPRVPRAPVEALPRALPNLETPWGHRFNFRVPRKSKFSFPPLALANGEQFHHEMEYFSEFQLFFPGEPRGMGKLFYLQLELFYLQLSFFAYSPLRPLLETLSHCKQKSSNCK